MYKEFLISHYYIIIQLIFLIVTILFLSNTKEIKNQYKEISKNIIIFFLILFFGFSLRMWFVPHIHHVYFDEFEHINISQNLSRNSGFQLTLKGSPENCEVGSLPAWPPGYHALLALVFSLLGATERVAYGLSVFLGTMSILIIFLITLFLFKDKTVSFWSAFLLSVLPVHLKYSGSSAPEITSSFFVLLLVWTAILYLKIKKFSSLLLFSFMGIATLYMRPENLIFYIGTIIFILIVIFYFKGADLHSRKIIKYLMIFIFLIIFSIPYFLQLFISLKYSRPPGWGESFLLHLSHFKNYFPENIRFWFGRLTPVSFAVFAPLGGLLLFKKKKKFFLLFVIWFLFLLLLYSFYHIGCFLLFPDSDRYTINLYLPLIIFSAFGIARILGSLKIKKFKKDSVIFLLILVILIDCKIVLNRAINKTTSREVYKEYRFILSSGKKLPEDLYIISYSPSAIIATIQKKSLTPFYFFEISALPEKAILFKNFWWHSNFTSLKYEQILKETYDFIALAEQKINSEVYGFYLLSKKPAQR